LLIYSFFILVPLLFGYQTIANRYSSMSLVICGSVVFDYYYKSDKICVLRRILKLVFLLSLITMIITYFYLLTDSYVSRRINSTGIESELLASKGIGGYSQQEKNVLYVSVRKKELKIVKQVCLKEDKNAFVNVIPLVGVYGKFFREQIK